MGVVSLLGLATRRQRACPTTEAGKEIPRRRSMTSAGVSPCVTIISAMSPTTLDDGVTLMMSPNMSLAAW
jgi:hypothetical protein